MPEDRFGELAGNTQSMRKINFEDMQTVTKNPEIYLLINTLPLGDHQSCLIHGTVSSTQEESAINKYLKENNLIQPDDIIVEVDGDDWVLHPFVLQYLNQVYQNDNIWMTYGQYIHYPSGELGGHYHLQLENHVDVSNSYRHNVFPYSHLKTYKAFLVDKITDDDLIDPVTGKYFNAASDFALCMPMVEMAGKSRIFRIDEPVYVYNVSADLDSETNNRVTEQKETEHRIRQKTPRTRL